MLARARAIDALQPADDDRSETLGPLILRHRIAALRQRIAAQRHGIAGRRYGRADGAPLLFGMVWTLTPMHAPGRFSQISDAAWIAQLLMAQ